MATKAGYLSVSVRGSTVDLVASGLQVVQLIDADYIGGIDFKVEDPSRQWDYVASTDTVKIVTTDGYSEVLTRVGDYFRWTIGANDLGGPLVAPGSSRAPTVQIVVERDDGTGIMTRRSSDAFTLTIARKIGFNPSQISGFFAQYDAYDTSEASGALVTTWDDKAPADRDLTEATNKPTKRFTNEGRPYLEFDGVNDLMTSNTTDFPKTCTAMIVAKMGAYDATKRGLLQVGGTNGGRIIINNANLIGASGANEALTTLPALNTWFIATMTKTDGGAVTIQLNDDAPVSNASVLAVTQGALTVGDTVADAVADIDIAEIVIFDVVLTAANIELLYRYLAHKHGVTL